MFFEDDDKLEKRAKHPSIVAGALVEYLMTDKYRVQVRVENRDGLRMALSLALWKKHFTQNQVSHYGQLEKGAIHGMDSEPMIRKRINGLIVYLNQ